MLTLFEKRLKKVGLSELTISSYVKDLQKLVEEGVIEDNLSSFNEEKFLDLNKMPATKARMLASVNKYAEFLIANGELDKSPTYRYKDTKNRVENTQTY